MQMQYDPTQQLTGTLRGAVDIPVSASPSVQEEMLSAINALDDQIAAVEKDQILLTALMTQSDAPQLGLRDRVKRYLQGGTSTDQVRVWLSPLFSCCRPTCKDAHDSHMSSRQYYTPYLHIYSVHTYNIHATRSKRTTGDWFYHST